ncbi:polyprenyl synthetase family protein [Rhodoferax antarcticus]|uniref:Farnesyl-diphosphate synthase n=1 Tax=Rhodoferax antarcticus ANT.BR TaxID=1111071 RepID=A0A1Q8YDA1_9BURK|nr:farnesyl diphosphate synthase [Rhodoferax antarcticus]APW45919.1 polyprenyl synthetase [Rhodoferax antarcticus]MCW2310540.1 farnesyl diphosphate synthase [Rhodoferax antarcticus]OLP06031.1 Farnesyl-diphosphate synthase [Rhodoferax antarcticus ANT.BR]
MTLPVAHPFDIDLWMTRQLAAVEQALDQWVSVDASAHLAHQAPSELMAAMRYAVLDGGKRLRPLLVMAACEAVQFGGTATSSGDEDADKAARRGVALQPSTHHLSHDGLEMQRVALRAACAVELIHAYSLVHDDMPCMDNDVLRRGKPTVHVKFGEASALLAGDALQALAFELLAPEPSEMPVAQQAHLCRLLARASGCTGMAGGQAIDLASVGLRLTESELQEMHRLKTGALLNASVMMGAACGHTSPAVWSALQDFGAAIGLAFQVVDDVLDVTADSATLGKTAGKDADSNKPTYVSLMGLTEASAFAQSLKVRALDALKRSGLAEVRALQGLAEMVVDRTH